MKWTNRLATDFPWVKAISNKAEKEAVAKTMAARVKNGDVIGIGSGSTSFLALQEIGKKAREEQLHILAIPTSHEVSLACSMLGIPVTSLANARPDWSFDGADEVDPQHQLIKGRGGALFAEKLVIKSCEENYILVDSSKFVSALGETFAVPVELDPRAIHLVEKELINLQATDIHIRMAAAKDGPVITEAGNLLLDVRFARIESGLEQAIKQIPGVIESGLFMNYPVIIRTNEKSQ